ncbi:MAG: MATE family efflux transporter [Oscillospiraceae bacterium]
MKTNAISQKFNTAKLLKFALPTIIMMGFLSTYTAVDGAFVSNLITEDALSAVNIVMPLIGIFCAVGLMLSTGANAIIAMNMGEGKFKEGRSFFSLIYIVGAVLGIIISLFCFFFEESVLGWLGCTPRLHDYARDYMRVLAVFAPMNFMQMFAQTFFVTAGKPRIGLIVTILGGLANVVLDYVFIAIFNMGIGGAALATGIGYSIPGIFGIVYFCVKKNESLHFGKPVWTGKKLLSGCFNGSSEFIGNLAFAITTLMFNLAMLKYVGENGVAAITIILYVQFIQSAIYCGYSMGIAPIISYKYGAGDTVQLKKIIKISVRFILICSGIVIILSILGANLAVGIFVRPESEVYAMAKKGFIIFSTSYIFMGINIFMSAMFTAFGNGKVSAILSFLRTLLFLVGSLVILPIFLGVDGIWLAVPVAEAMAFVLSVFYYKRYKKIYKY